MNNFEIKLDENGVRQYIPELTLHLKQIELLFNKIIDEENCPEKKKEGDKNAAKALFEAAKKQIESLFLICNNYSACDERIADMLMGVENVVNKY